MTYLTYNRSRYDSKTGKKVSIDYGIFIAGSKKQRTQVKKQVERASDLESLIGLLQEILSQNSIKEDLEDLIRTTTDIPYYTPPRRNFSSREELNSYLSTHESIVEVDSLGTGVGWKILGAYDPNTDTIYVLKNLNARERNYVLAHEKAHRRRFYSGESQDEYLVDREAAAIVGYDPFNRYRQAA